MTGKDFATYLALAYQVSYHAGLTLRDACTDYHTSRAWTAAGVAAVTARILSCDPVQIHEVAGIGEYNGPHAVTMICHSATLKFQKGFTYSQTLFWDLTPHYLSKLSVPDLIIWMRMAFNACWIQSCASPNRRSARLTQDDLLRCQHIFQVAASMAGHNF